MAAHGKLGLFLGLILPHGLLELLAVWIAGGVGLRLGWTLIDPGPRRRARGLRRGGSGGDRRGDGAGPRAARVSGLLEAFVTPSPLPTWARIAIGVFVWGAFIAWITVCGRRAVRLGDTGDLEPGVP